VLCKIPLIGKIRITSLFSPVASYLVDAGNGKFSGNFGFYPVNPSILDILIQILYPLYLTSNLDD
jgi:hypothetical protein